MVYLLSSIHNYQKRDLLNTKRKLPSKESPRRVQFFLRENYFK